MHGLCRGRLQRSSAALRLPPVPPEIASRADRQSHTQASPPDEVEQQLADLRARLVTVDMADAARRTGAERRGNRLIVKIMGKDFAVDANGKIYTDIHANPWVTIPVLNYILHCKGAPVQDQWVPLRELPSGGDWYRLFGQRCEKPMKKIADVYPELFSDLVDIFNGQPVGGQFQADVALVLRPLPRIPLLICYWQAEDGMESNLNLFFDASAEANLGISGIYALGTGITRMFEKLAQRHGIG